MQDFLKAAGFENIKIQVKENAAEIIKGWMPDSGAEKYITSAYVTASKPLSSWGFRDDVRRTPPAPPVILAPVESCPPEAAASAGC